MYMWVSPCTPAFALTWQSHGLQKGIWPHTRLLTTFWRWQPLHSIFRCWYHTISHLHCVVCYCKVVNILMYFWKSVLSMRSNFSKQITLSQNGLHNSSSHCTCYSHFCFESQSSFKIWAVKIDSNPNLQKKKNFVCDVTVIKLLPLFIKWAQIQKWRKKQHRNCLVWRHWLISFIPSLSY